MQLERIHLAVVALVGLVLSIATPAAAQIGILCTPGTFSANGFKPCTPCPPGTFSGEGADHCDSLPLPLFRISPTWFDFGDVPLGVAAPAQVVTVTNVSVAPIVVGMAGGAAGVFGGSQNCQGQTLAPGASCEISYRFTPNALGPAVGTTSGTINGQPFAFDFQGNGIRRFLISPIGFDFGDVPAGTISATQSVDVTNASPAAAIVSMAGGAAGVFGGSQNCQGQTLAAAASCQISYRFAPTVAGPATGTTAGSLNGQPFSFAFEGRARAKVESFRISPIGFDFGDVPLNAGSPQQVVTVTNVNVVALVVNMTGGAGGLFGGSQNCQGTTLAPGASCQIFYRFTPNALGPVVGSTAGSVNGLPFAFNFQGNGIRRFLISPIGFDFGEVAVGAMSQSQTVNVTNASSAAVTVNVTGGAAGVFGGSQNCQGQTLAPGASCQIFYRFAPVTGGPASGAASGTVNGQPFAFDFEGFAVPEPTGSTVPMVGVAALMVLAQRRRVVARG